MAAFRRNTIPRFRDMAELIRAQRNMFVEQIGLEPPHVRSSARRSGDNNADPAVALEAATPPLGRVADGETPLQDVQLGGELALVAPPAARTDAANVRSRHRVDPWRPLASRYNIVTERMMSIVATGLNNTATDETDWSIGAISQAKYNELSDFRHDTVRRFRELDELITVQTYLFCGLEIVRRTAACRDVYRHDNT